MDGAGAHPGGGIERPSRDLLGWVLPFATALVIVVVAVLDLTTPIWMHFALDSAGATGAFSPCGASFAYKVSDQTVNELLFGPGTFFATECPITTGPLTGRFYTFDEAAHLRDARMLLWLGILVAVISAVVIGGALIHRPRDARRWKAVARGGLGLAVGAVVIGVIGAFAFEPLFVLFHELFFPGGNWEFPPDSNMIRLYPYPFWELTALALGVLCVVGGLAVWYVGRRRARALA